MHNRCPFNPFNFFWLIRQVVVNNYQPHFTIFFFMHLSNRHWFSIHFIPITTTKTRGGRNVFVFNGLMRFVHEQCRLVEWFYLSLSRIVQHLFNITTTTIKYQWQKVTNLRYAYAHSNSSRYQIHFIIAQWTWKSQKRIECHIMSK